MKPKVASHHFRARRPRVAALAGAAALAFVPSVSAAQSMAELNAQIGRMQRDLAAQHSQLVEQAKRIAQQQEELDRLRRLVTVADRGSAAPAPSPPATDREQTRDTAVAAVAALPDRPVGGSPEPARLEQASAVPEGAGVLTRSGHFVIEPSLEYTNSSSNRLVFRGVELIPGIQVGLIEASDVNRDTVVLADTVRYGVTGDLEVEARVPVLFRSDRVAAMQQSQTATQQETKLSRKDLGDIELGVRYQLNHPVGEKPILIGTMRVKSDTGRSPFDVPFDSSGVAQGLATGSGFWAVQPGLSFLLPSDPVVIFGGASYLHQFPRNIDRQIGSVTVGHVDPADAIGANIGFGFALNPRFSFSLAYQHNYILPMHWLIDGTLNRADSLQIGTFALGLSYRLTERQTLNFGLEIGATRDAPDVGVIVRLPFSPK